MRSESAVSFTFAAVVLRGTHKGEEILQMVNIHGIGTAVPAFEYSQAFARGRMLSWISDRKQHRIIRRIYANSGIETRHSVLGDFAEKAEQALFKLDDAGKLIEPGTGARNDVFIRESRKLAADAARKAIEQCDGISAAEITHVVAASCTGFANPGLDYYLVRDLGLANSTSRFMLGFMGCYAAVPALHMAYDFCRANPAAVVLVVCVELCSLHLSLGSGMDSIISNAIFSDGAAAAILSARQPGAARKTFRIDGFASSIIPAGEKDMAWRIGDRGFEIRLSTYVPDLIGANIRALVESELKSAGLVQQDIDIWAIHPGGKAIVDKVEHGLELRPEQVMAARNVLRKYGNMSSPTILFVLKEIMEQVSTSAASRRVFAMAFGPGLTVESAVMTLEEKAET